jgi:hypothetical protein
MRTVDDCIQDLVPALMAHLVDEKLIPKEVALLRNLSDKIREVLGDDCGSCETENEDSGDEQEEQFSLKSACRQLTRELQNHRGEFTGSERNHLLELIESAAKALLNF